MLARATDLLFLDTRGNQRQIRNHRKVNKTKRTREGVGAPATRLKMIPTAFELLVCPRSNAPSSLAFREPTTQECRCTHQFHPAPRSVCLLQVSQPNVRTIEGVLFEAFVKSGAVSEENSDDPVKVSLARAARTDAGVHAAGNVVNMKLITSPPGVDDLVAAVNDNLPPEIRVWNIVRPLYTCFLYRSSSTPFSQLRVQNSFNSRS